MSPLHYAAEHGQSKVISVLLGNESVNRNILSGNIHLIFLEFFEIFEHPLHTAARHGQTHAIDSLLSTNPVENNPLDSRRNTPLHIAAMNGRIDSVQILLDGGGSKSAINADAMTPTDVAHGTYARNIQEALDGKLQNIMYLCEPDPYPQKKPQPQQEPPKPQQDSGCVVQ